MTTGRWQLMTEMAINWKSTSPIPYDYFTSKIIYSIVYLRRIRLQQGCLCYYPNLISNFVFIWKGKLSKYSLMLFVYFDFIRFLREYSLKLISARAFRVGIEACAILSLDIVCWHSLLFFRDICDDQLVRYSHMIPVWEPVFLYQE